MKILGRITAALILVSLLVLIRLYEYRFFYDPFMYFFEQAYQDGAKLDIPKIYYWNLGLRFLLNTCISLLILYLAFRSVSVVRFSAVVFLVFFMILFPAFLYLMSEIQPQRYLLAFYVRRFLAHPILLLLLLPAFYYQRLLQAKKQQPPSI